MITDSTALMVYMYWTDHMVQIYSGITCGRVLIGELYAQILQKLINLYLFTDCFMKISLQSSEQLFHTKSSNPSTPNQHRPAGDGHAS